MKIRIIKCDEPQAWYFNEIGEEYDVVRIMEYGYYVDDGPNGGIYVLKEDAEIITPEGN